MKHKYDRICTDKLRYEKQIVFVLINTVWSMKNLKWKYINWEMKYIKRNIDLSKMYSKTKFEKYELRHENAYLYWKYSLRV